MLYIKDIYPFKNGFSYELFDTEVEKVTVTGWTADQEMIEQHCEKYNRRLQEMIAPQGRSDIYHSSAYFSGI